MAAGQGRERDGILDGIKVDVVALHESWMQVLFPRQRGRAHSVLGKWKPTSTADKIKYRVWSAIGVPLIAVLYPLALLGFATRFYTRRIDSGVTRIGAVGTLLLAVVVWGALTVVARFRFGATAEGFFAVAAASVTAVVASLLAYGFLRLDGRPVTVLFAYPFAMTALFLPPVVAALYSPTVANAVLPGSLDLAQYFLDNVAPRRLSRFLRASYDLEGVAYVIMWFAIAVPVGWLLGIVVSLADVVRPKDDDGDDE
ncbi:hypothetical protein [Halosegnis marinus]|uniref:Uncharacterized protein n=1 Tax=Halosegnis marinus TaxID=3034023 RepID=A0ABD5ZR94_9EURY|nr:hypothetical protein [Halosegnis sp. DT85]